MEYFIFLTGSPGADERWWFCALCSELSTEGPWPRRANVPGAKAAVEFGHSSPRVKFSEPCLVSEVPDTAGVSASPCSEELLVPPREKVPWDRRYPFGTATLWAEERECDGRGRTCLGSGGFLQLTQRPLLNPVEKMIPGLVSMLGAEAGAALGRSNPGLLSFVVGFGAGTGKSTSSALPEQVPSAGIASLGTTAVTAGKGISWPRAQGRRNLSSPPSPGTGTTPWIKGTASQTAKSAFSTGILQGKCAGRCWQPRSWQNWWLSLNPVDPSDCQGFPLQPTLMDSSNFKTLPLHLEVMKLGRHPKMGWHQQQETGNAVREFNILLFTSPTFWHFHEVAPNIHSLGITYANHMQA